MRRVLRQILLPSARRGDEKRPPASLAMRLLSRIAGVVFPTNTSGNNMSVR